MVLSLNLKNLLLLGGWFKSRLSQEQPQAATRKLFGCLCEKSVLGPFPKDQEFTLQQVAPPPVSQEREVLQSKLKCSIRSYYTENYVLLHARDWSVPRFRRLVRPSKLQFQRSLRNWYWHSMIPSRMASRKVSASPGSRRQSLFCLRDSLSKSHCLRCTFPWAGFVDGPSKGKWVRASFPVRLTEERREREASQRRKDPKDGLQKATG